MRPQLTYRELKHLFANFLKENNALKQYKINLLKQRKREFKNLINYIDILTLERFNMLIESEKLYEFINMAFVWMGTPQGYGYWYELDKKWRNIIKQYQSTLKPSQI